MSKRRRSPLIIDALNALASRFVGDGNHLNFYFVTDRGHTLTVTDDYQLALMRWEASARETPLHECTLEDRLTGIIASIEPLDDTPDAPLVRLNPDYREDR
jgi:hypothetical protein